MRIIVLHGAIGSDAPPDEQDTLHQAQTVAATLQACGYAAEIQALDSLSTERLRLDPPTVVFNLVEAVNGRGALGYLGASLCESLGLPHTGNTAAVLMLTGHKTWAKHVLRDTKIPTPKWLERPRSGLDDHYILKSVTEDASIGIGPESVTHSATRLREIWRAREQQYGGTWFAERYIAGREFNLSLLQTEYNVEVLPIAEMRFWGYPPDQPQIMDYAAKWDSTSFGAQHTERNFELPPEDAPLLARLRQLALRAWNALGLRGYARVDFRVDAHNQPWILEVNANPCLDPEAGFAQAARQAGWSYPRLIEHLARLAAPQLAPTAPRRAAPHVLTCTWRTAVAPADAAAVFALVRVADVFTAEECLLARELVEVRLAQGSASGYEFILADYDGQLAGYTCYGAIPAAEGRFDLYWIVVAPAFQGQGLAQALLARTLAHIRTLGGTRVYAETSSTERYAPARAFYIRSGFQLVASLPDFYQSNDGKLFYQYRLDD